jgi:hypothetical protein
MSSKTQVVIELLQNDMHSLDMHWFVLRHDRNSDVQACRRMLKDVAEDLTIVVNHLKQMEENQNG